MREFFVERRIRMAAVMIGAGLLLQALTPLRIHPLAFVVFLRVSCQLIVVGIAIYLLGLVSTSQ